MRFFNDFPCINLSYPAFSQRAVDLLRDVLEANGELLPVRHKLGIYHFFNCTRLANAIDVSTSSKTPSGLADIGNLFFNEEMLTDELSVFKDRSLPSIQLCAQRFVDRVHSAGLQGFVFIPVWPLQPGTSYHSERYRLCKLAEKWKPNPWRSLEIKGNTVVLRLCCQQKNATKDEVAAAKTVVAQIERSLYDPCQSQAESYFGNVEGMDVVDSEIRIFVSTPDNERLLAQLSSTVKALPWSGKIYLVKRRGNFMVGQVTEEYIPV